jgi:hypothetical protein
MSLGDDAIFAIGDQKCIESPTDANDAYLWIADGYPIEPIVADITDVSRGIG